MPTTASHIRVAICDDLYEARYLASYYLSEAPDIEVVADCATMEELFRALRRHEVHVVLLDYRLAEGTLGNGIVMLRELEPLIPVIMWTGYRRAALPAEHVAMATGFLDKTTDPVSLIAAIRWAAKAGPGQTEPWEIA